MNRAIDRAIADENFFTSCLNLLEGLKFPAIKGNIIKHVKKTNTDSDTISLFETLDGYIEYEDKYRVQKALEEKDPRKKIASEVAEDSP